MMRSGAGPEADDAIASFMPRLRFAVAYAAIWVPVVLVFSFALGATGTAPMSLSLAAGTSATLPAALLGLAVIAVCGRLPWTRRRVGLLALVHVAAAVTFAIVWAAVIAGEIQFAATPRDVTNFLSDGLAWQLVIGLLTYSVIVGVTYLRAALRRQEEQERAAARAETLLLKAELGALRARLDPHFLFNVLQTIGALVEQQPKDAHTALELLGRLLKRRLGASRDDVSLAEELDDVREYCALERLRLGARLEVAEDIDPSTLELLVPQFTLQPLVENAIRHGIAPRATPGRLVLRTRREGEAWTLTVADNGSGADPVQVDAGTGVGLSVVRERLRLRHGAASTFAVTTAPGRGFAASLRLPSELEAVERNVPASAS